MNIMFIKMEEPKDFVTWLQVAKVCIENHVSVFHRSKIWNCPFKFIFFCFSALRSGILMHGAITKVCGECV